MNRTRCDEANDASFVLLPSQVPVGRETPPELIFDLERTMKQRCDRVMQSKTRTLAACAGGVLSLLALSGCDQRSEAAKSVEQASRNTRVLTGNGGAQADEADRGKTMTAVLGDAQKAAQSIDDMEKAAGNLLAATAQTDLAETTSHKATDLDLQARNKITLMSAMVNEWATTSSTVAAAEGFDPAEQLTELSNLRSGKQKEIAAMRSELQRVESEANSIAAAAKSKLDAAAQKQSTYSNMVDGTVAMSAVEAAKIVTEANVIRREGDALRLEGMRLQADAESRTPTIRDIRLKIEELTNQVRQFESTENTLRETASSFKAQVESATDAATLAANRLDGAVGELEAIFDGELKSAFEDAINSFSKARGSASSAQTVAPGVGRLSSGEAQLHIADMQWAKSQAFGNLASTLERLARVKPTLPQAAKYGESAAKYRGIQTEALKEAASAFESAKSAFDGARVSGPSKERLEQLGVLIEKARKVTSDESTDVATEFGLTPRAPKYTAEQEAAADGASDAALTKAIESLIEASKNDGDWTAFIKGPESILNLLKATGRVQRAVKSKLNATMEDAMGPMARGSIDFASFDASTATIAMNGADSATVMFEGAPMPMKFVKDSGAWKLDIMATMGPQAQMLGMMAGSMTGAMEAVAADIESGTITDPQEVGRAIQTKMMEMMGGK